MTTPAVTVAVTIISIWSKCPGTPGHERNAQYAVEVDATGTPYDILDRAFVATNDDDRPLGTEVCSTTAGDIMVLDDQPYLVEGIGFVPVTKAQAFDIEQLDSRETSGGLAYLLKHKLITP